MDRYVSQLIEKLAEAEASPTPEPDFGNSYEDFAEAMFAIETEDPVAAEYVINVSFDELPPEDGLTDQQIQNLTIALVNALAAKGTHVSFPMNGTPGRLVYAELRKRLKDGLQTFPGWNIDFCDGWCPGCAFFDYCDSWQNTWTKEEIETERTKMKEDSE
ncbi:MAG TPA: hypothetical protein DCG69_03250 [Bacteroidales bacterium]|nr:hypothetical protein [Bacteroidales bacterium]